MINVILCPWRASLGPFNVLLKLDFLAAATTAINKPWTIKDSFNAIYAIIRKRDRPYIYIYVAIIVQLKINVFSQPCRPPTSQLFELSQ